MKKFTKHELALNRIKNKDKAMSLRISSEDKAAFEAVAKNLNLSISDYLIELHSNFVKHSPAIQNLDQQARCQDLIKQGYQCHGYEENDQGQRRYYFSGPITRGGIYLDPTGEVKWCTLDESREMDHWDKDFLKKLKTLDLKIHSTKKKSKRTEKKR